VRGSVGSCPPSAAARRRKRASRLALPSSKPSSSSPELPPRAARGRASDRQAARSRSAARLDPVEDHRGARCRTATLYLLDGDKLTSRVTAGSKTATIEVALGRGIAGHVAKTGRSLRVRDAYRDRRFDRTWDKVTGFARAPLSPCRSRTTKARPPACCKCSTSAAWARGRRSSRGTTPSYSRPWARWPAVALEKAQLVRSLVLNNEQLTLTKERLEHSLHDLEFLYQLEAAVSRATTIDDIARSVITMTARACQAAAGALLVEASSGPAQLFVVSLEHPTEVQKVMVRPGEGIAAAPCSIASSSLPTIRPRSTTRRGCAGCSASTHAARWPAAVRESPRACGALALYNLERGACPSAPARDRSCAW